MLRIEGSRARWGRKERGILLTPPEYEGQIFFHPPPPALKAIPFLNFTPLPVWDDTIGTLGEIPSRHSQRRAEIHGSQWLLILIPRYRSVPADPPAKSPNSGFGRGELGNFAANTTHPPCKTRSIKPVGTVPMIWFIPRAACSSR